MMNNMTTTLSYLNNEHAYLQNDSVWALVCDASNPFTTKSGGILKNT